MTTYLITGNENKLRELKLFLPEELGLKHTKLNLVEIQSLDLHEIVAHKLKEAYGHMDAPVIVEDVSAELASLKGLPGPFVKFFDRLGDDALYKLGGEGDKVRIVCTMGYYDGTTMEIVDGEVRGTITAPRGENGFGFDVVVVPDGFDATFAEMTSEEKNTKSHRFKAAQKMAQHLESRLPTLQ